MDILFELYLGPRDQGIQWPRLLLVLLKRVLEAGYITIHRMPGTIKAFGAPITADVLAMTDKGRAFIQDLGTHEL